MKQLEDTASFVLRFTQEIYQNEDGEPEIRWKGYVRHIQGGDEIKFSDFQDGLTFLQNKMAEMTMDAMQEKTEEEQKGVLAKSFNFWKKVATDTPKLLLETIKDPKKQVENFQQQFHDFNENLNYRIETAIQNKISPEEWKYTTKADFQMLLDEIKGLKKTVDALEKKLDK